MKHPDPRRFSAMLEGDLTVPETQVLQAHLSECEACSSLLQDLQGIRRQARELPDCLPSRDLWPGIARAIEEETVRDPDVIRLLPGGALGVQPKRRGIHLSVPQAVAAGLALVMFSGAVGAGLGHGTGSLAGSQMASVQEEAAPEALSSWASMVGEARPSLEATALEVVRLERVLAEHGDRMNPGTAQVLERNLSIIDRAIRESVSALEADPGNRFLENNLERAVVAKGEYLRDATLLVVPTV